MTLLALALAAAVLGALPASAAPQDDANYISENIMSPFCPGVTLHDCPSDSAVALRDRITAMAESGMTRTQIMAALIDEYGETIRVEPTGGSGVIAWVLPAIAGLAGAFIAWRFMRGWARRPVTAADEGSDPVSPSDHRRIDAELDDLRGPA